MKKLCETCGREFEAPEPELIFDELDPSARGWIEKEQKECPDCLKDKEEE